MKTGLKKVDRTTEIYFDETSPIVETHTHNANLKNRLTDLCRTLPKPMQAVDEDSETGNMGFETVKGRFSIRLTAPYSDERRRSAREAAKVHADSLTRNVQKDMV